MSRKIGLAGLCMVSVALAIQVPMIAAQTLPDTDVQSSRPVVGGTAGAPVIAKPKIILGSQNLETLRHRDPTGKPCLRIGGYARPMSPSSKLVDHVIVADNA